MLTSEQLRIISRMMELTYLIANDCKTFNRLATDAELSIRLNVDSVRGKYRQLDRMINEQAALAVTKAKEQNATTI